MSSNERAGLVIAIDRREQRPYPLAPSISVTLPSGDYSIAGYEHRIAVERKRSEELFACVGRDRARFTRELERLTRLDYAAIVCECSIDEILAGSRWSRVSPRTVMSSLIAWSVRYRLPIWFAGTREKAMALAYRILKRFWLDAEREGKRGERK